MSSPFVAFCLFLTALSGCQGEQAGTQSASGPTAINLSAASAGAGDTVNLTAALVNSKGAIVATSNDIELDASQATVALKDDSTPDCTIDPAIGPASPSGKSIAASLPSAPPDRQHLRVGVIGIENSNALRDGPLYSCKLHLQPGAKVGSTVTVANLPAASDAKAERVAVTGTNGFITVR